MTLQEELSAFFSQMREEIMAMPDEDNTTIEEYLAKLRDDIENDRCEPVVADAIAPNINECEEETSDASSKEEESAQHEKPKFLDKRTFTLDDIFQNDDNKNSFIDELKLCGEHTDVANLVEVYLDRSCFKDNNIIEKILVTSRFVNFISPYLNYSANKDRLRRTISDTLNAR